MKNKKHKKFKEFNNLSSPSQSKTPSIIPTQTPQILLKKTVTPSSEPGFTGDPSKWFSNAEFYKNLQGDSDIKHNKDYYFNSYSTYYIHEEMIKDKVRTESYMNAIQSNTEQFKDKIVLDIGCGTGILSIFAARAGAKHVYGIEFAAIANYAKRIVQENNLSDKITIIQSKVEDAELPVKKVDIIISEWMGYFLLYESMFDTVIYARDKWLKTGGLMLPDRARMYLAGIEDEEIRYTKTDFWRDVYGFDMGCMINTALSEPLIDICPIDNINSTGCKIFDVDLTKVKKDELDFSAGYKIIFNRDDKFHGLVSWFDVGFEKLNIKSILSTSPYEKPTHWKQTIFYSKDEINVKKGEELIGNIAVIKDKANFRFIDIKISFHFDEGKGDWHQLYKIA